MPVQIENNSIILFQGDSITDAGRDYKVSSHLGYGYAMMISAWFSSLYPEKNVQFLNRGISGNRAIDLKSRWVKDCLDIKPNWVSIMIGINDTWRRYDSNDPTSPEQFESYYRDILTQSKNKLNAKFILMEPFVLPVSEDRIKYREDLEPKIEIVQKLAKEFNALLIPMDGIFKKAISLREPTFWAEDGVHPTLAGHALIARHWLKAIE
jgi:acyl-CoA thioesterase-1